MKIERAYFHHHDVVFLSRDLIGKFLFTNFNGNLTGGIITETEAYEGVTDKASHAFGNRRTARTEVMYAEGGTAYVYLCYGIHHLFNIVTNRESIPHAVLVRAIYPTTGLDVMRKRRGMHIPLVRLTAGPGTLSQALGIHSSRTGSDLTGNDIWLEDHGLEIPDEKVISGPRIGVDYAGDDALLPYRFLIKDTDIPDEYRRAAKDHFTKGS